MTEDSAQKHYHASETDVVEQQTNTDLDEAVDLTEFTPKKIDPDTESTMAQPWWKRRPVMIGGGVGVVVLLLLISLATYTFAVGRQLQNQATTLEATGRAAYTNFKAQNLPGAEAELKHVDEQLATFNQTYRKLALYNYVPVARRYYQDGQHAIDAADAGVDAGLKTIEAIVPYADVLGFSGEGTFEGGTAENRIQLMLETLDKVTPQLDGIEADLQRAEAALAEIDPNHYPETVKGKPVRASIVSAQEGLHGVTLALSDYRPFIEQLPEIAGANGERKKYLILFQNDNELRPTGGFLTAYAVVFVENGVVTPEKSDDIYELDKRFRERIPIPEALGRYLTTERYWNLRDMNTSPDFKTSMDQFFEHYQDVPGEPENIDGIIAVDTHVLTWLIEVVGPVQAGGYGTFTAETDPRCDCPQIIYALSEIITKPTPYIREDRKGILAPLMQGILQKVYASPRTFMADLFAVGVKSMEGRHLQTYFLNEEYQQAAEAIGAAGRLEPVESADQLAIVNANLGGAKSNLFIDYEVEQVVSAPENGRITKTVEITYKNSRKGDNCNLEAGQLCLNATLRDWTRLYVPEGSELVEAQGFVEDPTTYTEDGFTVFDGFFTLEPLGQAKLVLTYTVPYENSENYTLQMWKQGGINPVPVLMDVTGGQEQFTLDADTSYDTPF